MFPAVPIDAGVEISITSAHMLTILLPFFFNISSH